MRPDIRGRRLLAVAAVLIAIAVALPRFLSHTPYPRLGVEMAQREPGKPQRIARVFAPPAIGVLQPGDELVALDGRSLADSLLRDTLRAQGWPRRTITLTVRRAGTEMDVSLPPVQLSAWRRLRLYTYPVVAVIAAPIVAFLLVWRRPDLSAAWTFLWFATIEALGVVWSLFRYPQVEVGGAFRMYLAAYEWLAWLYPASFLHFMAVFPRPRWKPHHQMRSAWFWLTVLAYLTPVVFLVRSFATGANEGSDQAAPYRWFQTVALLLGAFSLVERYSRRDRDWNPTLNQRALALLVATALLLGAGLDMVGDNPRFMAMLPFGVVRVLFSTIFVAWLTTPFIIAFLIADDPAFDPRRLMVTSLPYALLSGVLAAIYLGIVFGGQRIFASVTGEQTLVFNLVAALILAFAFAPLRERVQRTIDRVYGRDPQALRAALDQAGRDLLSALDRDEVRAAVASGLSSGLRRPVAVQWPDSGAPRLADPEEVPVDARAGVENVLMQAGIRLENLALQESRATAERHAVELREAATRAELRALHAQVQPHFLFNALNALSYLTETDPPAAQRFTERLADMLRYTIEAGQRPAALLADEVAFVEDYLGVARERYENALVFEAHVPAELESATVPPLLLQPLVENSLKHGLAPNARALNMRLDACRENGWFTLRFADDGAPSGNGGISLGVGLENLEQRVRRFAGPEARMTAEPCPDGGYAVTLRWPAHEGGEA